MRDGQRRGHLTAGCIPTDQLGYALMTTGMAKRMGDDSTPSVAMNFNQVWKISEWLEQEWQRPLSIGHRRDLAAAAVTHLGFWLTWLRSAEFFSIDWEDMTITPPERHREKGLQEGVGVIEANLLPETKTNRTKQSSGYCRCPHHSCYWTLVGQVVRASTSLVAGQHREGRGSRPGSRRAEMDQHPLPPPLLVPVALPSTGRRRSYPPGLHTRRWQSN